MGQDPLADLLRRSPLTNAQRADLWDAFQSAPDQDALAARLESLSIPKTVKADLWELKGGSAAPVAASEPSAAPESSALSRFAGGAWEMLNPVTAVEGIYNAVTDLPGTAKAIYNASAEQAGQAKAAFERGDYGTAALRAGASVPVIGPLAADIAEQAQGGDYAGAAGRAVGLVAGPKVFGAMAKAPGAVVRGAARAARGAVTAAPEVADAARWALEQGIPVDAATVTGNKVARAAKWAADSSVGGAVPGMQAATARGEALARTGRGLARKVAPDAATAETAGGAVREGVEGVIRAQDEAATQAYGKVRAAERAAQPDDVPVSRPVGSGVTPEQGFFGHWLADDLDEMGYQAGGSSRASRRAAYDAEMAGDAETAQALRFNPRVAGTPTQATFEAAGVTGSRAEIAARIRKVLSGQSKDPKIRAVLDAYREAWDGQHFDWQLVTDETLTRTGLKRSQFKAPQSLPYQDTPGAAQFFGEEAAGLRASGTEPMQLAVPLAGVKEALRPVLERLLRKKELTGTLMGDEGRAAVALDAIVSGADHAPLSVVDAALSDLKAAARGAALPELRTSGQGVAAQAVKELETALQARAKAAGVWEDLRAGRDATIAKWTAADTLDKLRAEPVQTFRMLTQGGDAAIAKLREVQRLAPAEVPKIGRAWLEDALDTATAEGGFGREAKLWADWQRLGDETKALLYPDPAVRTALDKFFLIGKKLAENPNPSGSALVGGLSAQGFLTLIDPVTSATTAIGGYALSKLLNSPKVARLLVEGMQTPKTAPAAASIAARLRAAIRAVPKPAPGPAGAAGVVLSRQTTGSEAR